MKPIFLSRPTWVRDEHRQGLANFTRMLESRGLEPRTIGITDQPSMSPMDEVIELMKECFGSIILGVPQIDVQSGNVKGTAIKAPFCLGTEWNHIEAALAHALQLPVLLIHDRTVVRGVFDRGTTNTFLYSVDFAAESWGLSDQIDGAVKKWCDRLRPASISRQTGTLPTPTLKYGCYKFPDKEGLYCPACYENSGKTIPVPRLAGGHYKCPVCRADLC